MPTYSGVKKEIVNLKNKFPTPNKKSKFERDRDMVFRDFQNDFNSLKYLNYNPEIVYAEQTEPYSPMTIDYVLHPKFNTLTPFNPFYDTGGVFDTDFYSKLFFQILKHIQQGSNIFQIDSGFPCDRLHSFEHVYLTKPPKKLHILNRDRLEKLYLRWFFLNPTLKNNQKAVLVFSKNFQIHGVLKEATDLFEVLRLVILGELNEESS